MSRLKVGQIAAIAVLTAGFAWTSGPAAAQEMAAAHPGDRPAALPTPHSPSHASLPDAGASLPDARAPGTPALLGDWTAVDPATGMREIVTVTAETLTFGAAPPLPYHAERAGEGLALWLGDAETPLRFHFFDAANAQLNVPGGPAIALRREPAQGTRIAPAVAKVPEPDAIAEAAAALLP
ncbi:MAG: hypothetical protein ACM35H_15840, partial [Bacteroidota bacterium]